MGSNKGYQGVLNVYNVETNGSANCRVEVKIHVIGNLGWYCRNVTLY